ncbi:ribonuclease Z [Oceanirhabdus sp. W0125-5]|uniref:ribonuclease Z n=1 Tax=Oceanirhabdus sp. W0125-5 TaxID=2999116 RepID=UPI0022F324DE|nr:ribonuclease Z [Oceanirhabdus sp. W0125-5]WBW97006.1 ribonuclease Z [Oceanirhabdus sp. W0125-5]
MIDITLLGCGGSLPTPNRSLTSLFLSHNGKSILIDCGEGTQVSMKIAHTGFKNIDIICLTHVHADHVAGLPGLLLTIGNSGRVDPLLLVAPTQSKDILTGLLKLCMALPFEVRFLECNENRVTQFHHNGIDIQALPVEHSIPTVCYSFNISRKKKFNVNKALSLNIPKTYWSILQSGDNVEFKGTTYTPDMVLGDDRKGIKICYCTDTRPIPELNNFIYNSDLFICEGMYGDDAELSKAIQNKHMLFSEAAHLSQNSNVKELWLTHFSPSLSDPIIYLDKTQEIFKNTILGEDRLSTTLKFE